MSRLTTLTEANHLCAIGPKPSSFNCGDCMWHTTPFFSECTFAKHVDIGRVTQIQALANTL